MQAKELKKIYQYTAGYNFIKEWNSINDILIENKVYKRNTIYNNVRLINKTAYGYIWSYNNNLHGKVTKDTCAIDEKCFIENNIFAYPDDKEYWKDVINYETQYKISNHGRVYSKQSNIIMKNNERDYLRIKLVSSDSVHTTYFIHVLVAKHFVSNPNNNNVINHIDHNKYNNHHKNLEWLTPSQNSQAYHNQKVKHKIIQCNLKGCFVKEWTNIDEILENNKTYTRDSILRCLAGSTKYRYGYIWKYKDDNANQKRFIDMEIRKDEIFKNIGTVKGFDFSLYEVSNYGKVRNVKTQQILRPGLSTTGYYVVSLTYGDKNKITQKVHQLVAHKFCERPSESKNCVNHIDENKLNNHYKNLEWLTSKENTIHSTGKKVQQLDFKTGEIINTHDSIACAARSVGLNSVTCIRRVCQGLRKTSGGYKWKYVD